MSTGWRVRQKIIANADAIARIYAETESGSPERAARLAGLEKPKPRSALRDDGRNWENRLTTRRSAQ
jgi:hypothetical protein